MIRLILSTYCALVLSATLTAHAHTVWIESKDQQLLVRFAEPGDAFETSPGYLDSLSAPGAFSVITNAASSVEAPKKSDHFLLATASATNVAGVQTTFTVRGGRMPIFYARWQPAGTNAARSLLTLDVVPTGKVGEARVYFRGQPLGGVKANLRTPDGKDQELTADAEGYVRYTSTQTGLHLLTIPHHRENLAGFHEGRPYTQTSHNGALSWKQ